MDAAMPLPNPSRSELHMPEHEQAHQQAQPQQQSAQDAFLGVSGKWKLWTNLGIAGVVCGLLSWLIMHELPSARKEFNDIQENQQVRHQQDIAAERKAAREDAAASRAHGDRAVKDITTAIMEQTRAITEHQRELIGLQKKALMVGPPPKDQQE
jgi:hypothetical protein